VSEHAAAAVDQLQVLILRQVLGDRGVLYIARCVAFAEDQTRRQHGYGPPASLLPARALLATAAREVDATPMPLASANAVSTRTEANGSAEVPSARRRAKFSPVEWITPQEAAEMLGCSDRNVRDLCARGALESAQRKGSRWLVDRAEISARVGGLSHG
jgi:excisionase family DNA binding protein